MGVSVCSPGRTRTSNPSVNSRTLCQLSYRGLTYPHGSRRSSRDDSSVPRSSWGDRPGAARRYATVRQDGPIAPSSGGTALIRYVVVLGLGYVLGAKAGRRRYEQIVGTYRALTSSPAAKSVIEAGRRKLANRVSPDARMVTLTEIDSQTSVVEPQQRKSAT
jgi:hypothetical protein